MKTIALLTRRMYNGGIERVVSLLIPILNQAGYETVLLTSDPVRKEDYPVPETTKRFVIPVDGEERQEKLSEILIRERVDVLFCHDYSGFTLEDDLKTAKKKDIRTLITWHNVFTALFVENDEFFIKKIIAALSADMILTLSRTDEYFFKCCGANAKYIQNPLPFQIKRQRSRSSAKDSPIILFPARISPEKNPLDAIRIFAEVHKVIPQAIMKIAGADKFPDLDAKITAQISKQKLQDSVFRQGFCSDMLVLYKEADVMLMTSYNEGFPMTLLEAKANALPIVAYDLPYLETMQPQTGVLTITSGNISGAAMQVINLLQDSDLYRKVSAEGLENALAFSSFDFVEAYQKIMTALFDPIENDLPLYGDLMLRTLQDSIKIMRRTVYNNGYRDGQKNILNGMTYKIGHILMWLPVKLKRLLFKDE